MYNQQVTYKDGAWKYTPVKYWPNEYGNTANSEDADKVSFFAYAPWIEVVATSGKPTKEGNTTEQNSDLQKWGINSVSRNSATGDPIVKYLVDFDPTHSVDLCWGVNDGSAWNKVVDGKNQEFSIGLPWLNVQRPADAVSQKLKFTFKHALSKLNVQIDAFVDGINNANEIAAGTRVYVRSITFEGLATKGALNLNNETRNIAKWMDYNGTNDLVTGEAITIYDGRKDGKEGTLGGEATNEKVLGLNPALVQTKVWKDDTNPGVTNTPVNLFRKSIGTDPETYTAAGLNEPVYVIPTGDPVKVTIVYDIETEDKGLATYVSDGQTTGSSIENVISKTITFGGESKFENGKAYTLKLHLGMNSVKFDASVTDWEVQSANDIDLPANIPAYAVSATTYEITVPADAATYNFAITGLTAEGSVTGTPAAATDNILSVTTSTTANASGVAIVEVKLQENTSVKPQPNTNIVWNDDATSNKVTLKITQQPHALGLSVSGLSRDSRTITLGKEASDTWNDEVKLSPSKGVLEVKRNGVMLSWKDTPSNDNEYKFDDGVITFYKQPALGDIYTITVGAGEASAETVTAGVGGITYVPAALTKDADITFTNPLLQYGEISSVEYKTSDNSTDVVDVNVGTGEVKTLKVGTKTITATATTPANGTNGWFYPNGLKNASYDLEVKRQAGTISFANPTMTVANIVAVGSSVTAQQATLKGAAGNVLSGDADKIGTVTYSIIDGNDTGKFALNEVGKVRIMDTIANGTYTLTVKATVSDGDAYTYAVKEATYKLTVTVAL